MTRIPFWLLLTISGALIVLSGAAISAQDKYTLQVPGGLAFSEFRGYESWPVISISENGCVMPGWPASPRKVGGDWRRECKSGSPASRVRHR